MQVDIRINDLAYCLIDGEKRILCETVFEILFAGSRVVPILESLCTYIFFTLWSVTQKLETARGRMSCNESKENDERN